MAGRVAPIARNDEPHLFSIGTTKVTQVLQLAQVMRQLVEPRGLIECPKCLCIIFIESVTGPPQMSQQSSHHKFKPRGKQFKNRSSSSSSGSDGSSSGSSMAVFCGQYGGRHTTMQCVGVQGFCHIYGKFDHFARVCPSVGGQRAAPPP
ncbi:hypothetical protein F511_17190 [Dorcoceras hygrometricum]|uniref:Uncharacterized protein n=1 Tax=Dorcoceras hygrometricum TaxID=472368 RepID=A0A2Z7B8Q6_9LAMI|nr:hypothetical protein F511_17190 [Dorcoceras hygrometricum]